MKYKGYTGIAEFDEESEVIFGHVIGLRDVITFQGESVAELIQAFHDSVDDYLAFCASRAESPEKPFSGQLLLRIPPELHRGLSHVAETSGVSLNKLIQDKLQAIVERLEVALSADRSSWRPESPDTGHVERPRRRIIPSGSLDKPSAAKPKNRKKSAK
jgi:predicted HicB family RNase H-like nuclease